MTVRAVLVSVWLPAVSEADHLASLAEMGRLAHTLGFTVVHTVTQRRRALGAASVIGAGKLAELARLTGGSGEIPSGAVRHPSKAKRRQQADAADGARPDPAPATDAELADADSDEDDVDAVDPADGGQLERDGDHGLAGGPPAAPGAATPPTLEAALGGDGDPATDAEVVIIDNDISPAQIRNLEKALDVEVLDRSAIIIEIFHRHARTREARLQVELARLAYEAPRLREKPKRGDRQRAGSVGGAGESDLELDRRRIRDRMAVVRREIEAVATQSGTRRAQRQAENKVALVGYTNAGKSSLMRALTGSEVLVADQLFATLGTTVRLLGGTPPPRVLVSDTVGFIKNLPHDLVASFRSTLDEAHDASLLLFVVDAADPAFRSQLQVTRDVLGELGVAATAQRLVLNKCDRLDAAARQALAAEFPDAWQMSALAAADVDALRARLRAFFERDWEAMTFVVPYRAQTLVPEIHLHARVLEETYDAHGATLQARGDPQALRRLAERLAALTAPPA